MAFASRSLITTLTLFEIDSKRRMIPTISTTEATALTFDCSRKPCLTMTFAGFGVGLPSGGAASEFPSILTFAGSSKVASLSCPIFRLPA